jgi:hypothetical protein
MSLLASFELRASCAKVDPVLRQHDAAEQGIVRKSGPGFTAARCGTTKRPEHRTMTINRPML